MKYPYLITSDQHCHNWSSFSSVLPSGVNSRLQIILDELTRAHETLANAGGNRSFYAGDLFHVRGNVAPSVLNPTFSTIRQVHLSWPEMESFALAGNHDLEGRNADELGNAMQQLALIENFNVVIEPTLIDETVLVISWVQDLNELREILSGWSAHPNAANIDVIIHAPLNGVIKGLPDHGLDPDELAALGFRRVFIGHYHNHKSMAGGKVFSVGATSHQTWNDPNTAAGFLLVYEDRVVHVPTAAPLFVDLERHDVTSEAELMEVCSGNYVRAKLEDVTEAEIKQWRDEIMAAGALGVNIIATKAKKAVSRDGETTRKASTTLEASVADYIEKNVEGPEQKHVQKLVADFVAQARAASE